MPFRWYFIKHDRSFWTKKHGQLKNSKMHRILKWKTIKHTKRYQSYHHNYIFVLTILIEVHFVLGPTMLQYVCNFAIAKQHFWVCTWKVKYWINSYFKLCLNTTCWFFMNGEHSSSHYVCAPSVVLEWNCIKIIV